MGYTIVLTLHNITRWLVIVFGILAIVRGFTGISRGRKWDKADDRAGMLYSTLLDVQLLLGLLLYFLLSPITTLALKDFGAAMANAALRYFSVEHAFIMLLAVIVAHVARALSKKAKTPRRQHLTAAVGYAISFLMILAAIPWPFLANGRPLLRFFGLF